MARYNIAKANGETMLGMWVDLPTAVYWLIRYLVRYKPGKPYPNGEGHYPDFGFHIVHKED